MSSKLRTSIRFFSQKSDISTLKFLTSHFSDDNEIRVVPFSKFKEFKMCSESFPKYYSAKQVPEHLKKDGLLYVHVYNESKCDANYESTCDANYESKCDANYESKCNPSNKKFGLNFDILFYRK